MNVNYSEIIEKAKTTGSVFDAMLAIQSVEGYLSLLGLSPE